MIVKASQLQPGQLGILLAAPEPFSGRCVAGYANGPRILSTIHPPGMRLLWPTLSVVVRGTLIERVSTTIDMMQPSQLGLIYDGFKLVEKRKDGVYRLSAVVDDYQILVRGHEPVIIVGRTI